MIYTDSSALTSASALTQAHSEQRYKEISYDLAIIFDQDSSPGTCQRLLPSNNVMKSASYDTAVGLISGGDERTALQDSEKSLTGNTAETIGLTLHQRSPIWPRSAYAGVVLKGSMAFHLIPHLIHKVPAESWDNGMVQKWVTGSRESDHDHSKHQLPSALPGTPPLPNPPGTMLNLLLPNKEPLKGILRTVRPQ